MLKYNLINLQPVSINTVSAASHKDITNNENNFMDVYNELVL